MKEKEYVGVRQADGTAAVYVVRDGEFRPLRHQLRHSPTGFEWGYGGSGPADLARSLLYDATGSTDGYQHFKWEVVARFPSDYHRAVAGGRQREEWRITEREVREWAERNRSPREAAV